MEKRVRQKVRDIFQYFWWKRPLSGKIRSEINANLSRWKMKAHLFGIPSAILVDTGNKTQAAARHLRTATCLTKIGKSLFSGSQLHICQRQPRNRSGGS